MSNMTAVPYNEILFVHVVLRYVVTLGSFEIVVDFVLCVDSLVLAETVEEADELDFAVDLDVRIGSVAQNDLLQAL